MRFDIGYVKLYRKIMNSDLYQKGASYLGLWLSLLIHASRYSITVANGTNSKKFPPGSIVIGLDSYAKELKLTTSELRTRLRYLENTERITIDSSNSGTVITIRNWSVFQNDESAKDKPIDIELQENDESVTNESIENIGAATNEPQPNGELQNKKRKEGGPKLPSATDQDDSSKELRAEVWNSYKAEFEKRYGAEPIRNAKFNSLAKQLVHRVGAQAPAVAGFYVRHNKPFYVDKGHQLEYCLKDCETLLLELRGKKSSDHAGFKRVKTAFERSTNWDEVLGIDSSGTEVKNDQV